MHNEDQSIVYIYLLWVFGSIIFFIVVKFLTPKYVAKEKKLLMDMLEINANNPELSTLARDARLIAREKKLLMDNLEINAISLSTLEQEIPSFLNGTRALEVEIRAKREVLVDIKAGLRTIDLLQIFSYIFTVLVMASFVYFSIEVGVLTHYLFELYFGIMLILSMFVSVISFSVIERILYVWKMIISSVSEWLNNLVKKFSLIVGLSFKALFLLILKAVAKLAEMKFIKASASFLGKVREVVLIIFGIGLVILGVSLTLTWITFCFSSIAIGILLLLLALPILLLPLIISFIGLVVIVTAFDNLTSDY
jgi:hypothetical protein